MGKRQRVAIIHIGSISLRLKIYELTMNEAPKEIESVRRFLAIGAQTYKYGVISTDQVAQLCQILAGFVVKLMEYKLNDSICVATSAFGEAKNCDFVMEQIRLHTGFEVQILDNAQERYYHNLAIKQLMTNFDQIQQSGTLLLDIGAGSIQSTVYDKSNFVFSQNMLLGSLRISDLLSNFERQTASYTKVLDEFIAHDLEDYYAVEPKGISYQNLIAFGSDIGFLKAISGYSAQEYCFIHKERFLETFEYLVEKQGSDLILTHNIPSASVDLLLPMALVIKKSLEYTGVSGIHMPAVSLCDGIILQHVWEHCGFELIEDPSLDTISAARHVSKRYRYDKKHADAVERVSLAIFDSMKRQHGMNNRQRLLLQLSSILHEVGKYINVSHHNIRSYHIIHTTEIIGLNGEEREIIAYVARFYTEAELFLDKAFQSLTREQRLTISKLTAILRIADAMDASHKQKIQSIAIVSSTDSLAISFDAEEDISYELWAFSNRINLFLQVFGSVPMLKPRRKQR